MELYVTQPLKLSVLAAFYVVENNLEKEELLDELSREEISLVKANSKFSHFLYRAGKKNKYLEHYAEVIESLQNIYWDIKDHKHEEDIFRSFIVGFPTPDAIVRYPQETKDALLELFLFWEKIPIEKAPESLFNALCN